MSFLKKINRAGHSFVKIADKGLRWVDKSAHLASGLLHQSHLGYRTIKRVASKALPGAGVAFAALEWTPEAKLIKGYREDAESKLNQVHPTIQGARAGVSLLNRGIEHPRLKSFIHS